METILINPPTAVLPSPAQLMEELPLGKESFRTISDGCKTIENIIRGKDSRLLLIAGPCSVHDPEAALDYANRLNNLRKQYQDSIVIIMRVYLEKPRTSIGWKGLINDPYMDNSCNMSEGLRCARKLLLSITSMGMPAGMEFLDPLISHYIGDLASWAAIGARTSESQIHREMASGLNIPIGFKNSTDGSLEPAINSIIASGRPNCFLSVNKQGQMCIKRTEGNWRGHLILRGGKQGPNYDDTTLQNSLIQLTKHNLNQAVVVDCSHMNAGKQFQNQIKVWRECLQKRKSGLSFIKGLMIESNICEGNQSISDFPLLYGVSITDECLGWEATEEMIRESYVS